MKKLKRKQYDKLIVPMQSELVAMARWAAATGQRICIIFEGRDTAGKGGAIAAVAAKLNPRQCKIVALPKPSDIEHGQWYFQRYAGHLPGKGEITLFDRSWYNRAGVERVMGFCSETEVQEFFRTVPEFERMLVRSGIVLLKYWFSITDPEQNLRFLMRINDPLKQWKLSPMDLQSRRRWEEYTKAKEEMLARTHIHEAPWWVVDGNHKRRARLNCIHHMLQQVPYGDVQHQPIVLPQREHKPDYARTPVPESMYVPAVY